jgi:hypothetical protein
MLEAMLAEAFCGEKIVEVKPVWANKGGGNMSVCSRLSCSPTFCSRVGD